MPPAVPQTPAQPEPAPQLPEAAAAVVSAGLILAILIAGVRSALPLNTSTAQVMREVDAFQEEIVKRITLEGAGK